MTISAVLAWAKTRQYVVLLNWLDGLTAGVPILPCTYYISITLKYLRLRTKVPWQELTSGTPGHRIYRRSRSWPVQV